MLATLRRRFRRWATRTKTPEVQPITLHQSRVYVFPTRAGFALLLTLLLMFIGAVNYNLSLGYALSFFLASIGVIHILHSWRTLTRLEITLQAEGEAFAGAGAYWQLQLHNRQSLRRPAIRILDDKGRDLLLEDLAPQSSRQAFISLPCPLRGPQQIGLLTIETRQPLGWIRAWSYIEPDAPHLIYPAPEGSLNVPQQAQTPSDNAAGRGAGHDDFAGLRSFQPGDSLRHVAWKQLARGQGMLTKLYSGGQIPACVLSWHALPANLSAESKLSQLCQWVLAARQGCVTCTLQLPDGQIGPGNDAIHYTSCLTRLALFGKGAPHV